LSSKLMLFTAATAIVLAALGTGFPPATAVHAAAQMPKVTFRLSWTKEGTYASYYLTKLRGWYADEGLDVTILEGNGSGTNVQLIGAKKDTFALADGTAVMGAVQKGTPVVTVATVNQLSPYGLICRQDRNIKTVKDLAGKTVIMPGGSGQALIFPAFLKQNGLDPSKVTVVNGDSSAMGPAVLEGKVDCAVDFALTFVIFSVGQSDVKLNTILFGENGANTVSQGIITHPDTVKEHPDWVNGFVKATLRGNEYTAQHPDQAIDALIANGPDLKRDTELKVLKEGTVPSWHRNPRIPWGCSVGADWEFSQKVLKEQGVLSKTLPVSTYYTNKFVPAKCP
jgi:NitT/TauT family transport system substrate-binding protein